MANFFFKKKQYVSSLVDLLPIVAVGSTVIVLDFRRIRTQIFRVKGNYYIIASWLFCAHFCDIANIWPDVFHLLSLSTFQKSCKKDCANQETWTWEVGGAVASISKGPGFESSHRQIFMHTVNIIEKMTINKKRGRSLPTPEVHGSNPVIGKSLFILSTLSKRRQ